MKEIQFVRYRNGEPDNVVGEEGESQISLVQLDEVYVQCEHCTKLSGTEAVWRIPFLFFNSFRPTRYMR